MSETAHKPAIAEDLLALPADRSFEILGGEIVEKAAPSGQHGAAQLALGAALAGPFQRRRDGGGPGGWWLASEVDVELEAHQVIRPDLVGWRRERVSERPSGFPVRVRPDWVCEVLSPATADRDLGAKMRLLHAHAVGHYWVVDPEHRVLTVYRWSSEGWLHALGAGLGDIVRAEPFDAIELSIGLIFGVDPEL